MQLIGMVWWRDTEQITICDKLFKKFKTSKLQIDKELYNEARNKVQSLIKRKKKTFYEEQLKDNVNKSKELWKTLKSLGTSNKKHHHLISA